MAHESGRDLQPGTQQDLAHHRGGLTVSPVSQEIQSVGRHLLDAAELLEVSEDVFSTCKDPIEGLAERLLRARDTGVPLVEITMVPEAKTTDVLRQLFGIDGRPVLSILRSDGVEHEDRFWGKHINFDELGLSIPGAHEISLDGTYGSELSSVLSSSRYIKYDTGDGSYSTGFAYEGSDEPMLACDSRLMKIMLELAAVEFEIAVRQDGTIEAMAVEVPEEPQQLPQGDR